jgi:phage terminase large subunit
VTRADSARPETISYMQRHGYPSMVSVEKWSGSVEDGVAFMWEFGCIVIHPRCTHVAEEMRTYTYKLNRLSGDVLPDLVDKANHTIDTIRYALLPLCRKSTTGMREYYREQ